MKHNGIATDDSYGGYLQAAGYCHFNSSSVVVGARLAGYMVVPPYDADAMKLALYNIGPVQVDINFDPKALRFYSSGVIDEPNCKNSSDDTDHSVLLVGYGKLDGKDYWLVKNSWSIAWGNSGYFLISQKDNMCGILNNGTIPILQ
jgi:hypothetical protein